MSYLPFGPCECADTCDCKDKPGPAAYEVERSGKTIHVCTRCDLTSDKNKRLLLRASDNAKPFIDYDALGAMCILFDLSQERKHESHD